MRITYWGTDCVFSAAPLRVLIEAGQTVCAVVVPVARSRMGAAITPLLLAASEPIPLSPADQTEAEIVALAWEQHIPVYQVSRLTASEVAQALAQWQADVACVACFPWRIPASLLRVPPHGFLNVHPSLLPDYRGPYPLFWMFRNGEQRFGVTIHLMDEHLDTGDIVAQAEVDLPDGVSGEEADRVLAQYGGELLAEVLESIARGTLTRRPQTGGHYGPPPLPGDFALDVAWSARRAFNFMRGTAEWNYAYPLEVSGRRFLLRHAQFYVDDEVLDTPDGTPYRVLGAPSGGQIDVQFARGVLRAELA